MESNLTLQSERIAEVYFGGLRPSSKEETELTSESVVNLELRPKDKLQRFLNRDLVAGGLAARISDTIQEFQNRRARMIADIEGAVSAAQMGTASFANVIGELQDQRSEIFADIGGAPNIAQMRLNQIHQLLQQVALHHPEFAAAALEGNRSSVSTGSVVTTPPQWLQEVIYWFYSLPSVTWRRIRENPKAATTILISIFLWLVPPPYSWHEIERGKEKRDHEDKQAIVARKVEVRSSPRSSAIITDTLYYNNPVDQVDEHHGWTEIEYRDHLEGKKKQGWVRNHYLD